MFTEKEIEAYRQTRAPKELYHKIKGAERRKLRIYPLLSGLAACLALVVVLGLMFRNSGPNIVLNGQVLEDEIVFYDITPVSDVRTSPVFSVPVELKLSRRTEIAVSHGHMTVDGGAPTTQLTASSSVVIWWEIDRSAVMPACEMEIRDSKGTTLITLNYNHAEITATKKEKRS